MTAESWRSAALVLAVLGALFAALEWVVRKLSPTEREDPRLGVPAFWVWVISVAAVTYFLEPQFNTAGPGLELLSLGFATVGWIGWKLGVNRGWEDSPRDREEIWASTVGIIVGLGVRQFGK